MHKKLFYLISLSLFSLGVSAQDGGLDFDAVDDYVSTNVPSISGSNSRTIEAWVKTSFSSKERYIIDMGSLSNGNGGRFSLKMEPFSGRPRIEVGGSHLEAQTNIGNNQWHHVAVSYDDNLTGANYKIYVDGVMLEQGIMSDPLNTTSTNNLSIGVRSDLSISAPNTLFEGQIDEVRIWDVVRTASEISNNMNNSLCGEANLIAYFDFDEGTPSGNNSSTATVNDNSGNNYIGTLNNFALSGGSSNFISGASVTGNSLDTNVTVSGLTLTADQGNGATYQWIDCATNMPISGETSQSYTAATAGNYAVEISLNGCITTTTCFATTCPSVTVPYFEDFSNGDSVLDN